jgi:hypothetical protein
MALIGNYSVYDKLPLKYLGGANATTAIQAGTRSNFSQSGRVRSRMMQDQTTNADEKYALPNGGYPSLTWFIPQQAGGIGSSNQIYGDGEISLNLAGGLNATAGLSGSGNITNAQAQLIVQLVASIAGSGTVSAADIRGFLQAVANLSGSGGLTATASALAWISAATNGSGTITNATPYATGDLSADIFSFSALTPEGISNAVWAAIIEAGYSASDMLKLITASAAGKLSGSPGSPIQITGVDGSTVRIDATVDGAGNRTAVTYNVS